MSGVDWEECVGLKMKGEWKVKVNGFGVGR